MLSFDVPSVGGKWHGTISGDGAMLNGSWSQGTEMPLVFRREEPFAAAEKPSRVDGIWLGTIDLRRDKADNLLLRVSHEVITGLVQRRAEPPVPRPILAPLPSTP